MSKPIGADEMLDRIEELELAVRYEADLAQQALDAREKLEAKLAKAVEGLRDAAEDMDGYVGKGYGDLYRDLAEELTNTEKGQYDEH